MTNHSVGHGRAVKRVAHLALLLVVLSAEVLRAANPGDLKFDLRLVGDSHVFHQGEAIPLEFSYSSENGNKYQGSFSDPRPEYGAEKPEVTPSGECFDYWAFHDLLAGSFPQSFGYVPSTPRLQHMDLTDWCKFGKAGHYSLRLKSTAVSRVKTVEEGGGRERLTLESNAVDFEILPADAAWQAEEQAKFDEVLRTQPADSHSWSEALKRLAKLNTPSSASRLVELYITNDGNRSWAAGFWIQESFQLDVAIPALLTAISDPTVRPPDGITALVAALETRKKLGPNPPYSDDPVREAEREAELKERSKTRAQYQRDAEELLLASIARRSGPERAVAIYQSWQTAERWKNSPDMSEEKLAELRTSVLSVRDQLPPDLQKQLAFSGWQVFPHALLLPMVRSFAKESLDKGSSYDYVRLWCEEEPEPCNQAILDAMQRPGPKPYKTAALLLTESEHPELDDWLREELRNPEMVRDSANSQTFAAMILRAGSKSLLPDVSQLLDKLSATDYTGCEMKADLLGYIFRFRPKEAAKRLGSELQGSGNYCAGYLLRTLHTDRYSDDLVPVALVALRSPNLAAVGSAALFVAEHGPPPAEETLWQRLDALHETWRDRAAEFRDLPLASGNTQRLQAVNVEQQLASALMRSKTWQLSASEVDRLRSSCLTDQCRSIADGKMHLRW